MAFYCPRHHGVVKHIVRRRRRAAVIREASGETVPVHIIAVEKNEPFSTGAWELTGEVLDEAEKANEAVLARYRKCLFTGNWPTGYEEPRIISAL